MRDLRLRESGAGHDDAPCSQPARLTCALGCSSGFPGWRALGPQGGRVSPAREGAPQQQMCGPVVPLSLPDLGQTSPQGTQARQEGDSGMSGAFSVGRGLRGRRWRAGPCVITTSLLTTCRSTSISLGPAASPLDVASPLHTASLPAHGLSPTHSLSQGKTLTEVSS